jgi:hypothetical protein
MFLNHGKRLNEDMKNIVFAILLLGLPSGFYSCATVEQDVAGPAEPADTDTLEDRVEPKYLDKEYNPEVEEEIESDINPLETQEDEDAPLIK